MELGEGVALWACDKKGFWCVAMPISSSETAEGRTVSTCSRVVAEPDSATLP